MANLGAGHDDIAAALGVAISTLNAWESEYPEFSEALLVDPGLSETSAERALLKRALGYTYPIEKHFQRRGEIIRVHTTKHVPPEVKAADMWLRSHMAEVYGNQESPEDNKSNIAFLKWFAARKNRTAHNDAGYRGEESCRIGKAMALLGASDREISAALGITISTFNAWRDRHPEFSEALSAGKNAINVAVENALVRRALGYSYSAEKVFCAANGTIIRKQTIQHLSPDVGAAHIWLCAHRPELYSMKKASPTELKDKVSDALGQMMKEMTEEMRARRAELARLGKSTAP